jgi:hypothetical protein
MQSHKPMSAAGQKSKEVLDKLQFTFSASRSAKAANPSQMTRNICLGPQATCKASYQLFLPENPLYIVLTITIGRLYPHFMRSHLGDQVFSLHGFGPVEHFMTNRKVGLVSCSRQ